MLKNKIHITYCTIEDISSGLFQTQVIDIIQKICETDKNITFEILVVNRFWHILNHLRMKQMFEKSLSHLKIKIIYLPLLPPLRHVVNNKTLSIIISEWLKIIFKAFVSKKTNIIHARSYWPAYACSNKKGIPIIFDMRSLWVLEHISSKDLIANSKAHEYWACLEKKCLSNSTISTVVSEAQKDFVKKLSPNSDVRLIPISVSIDRFSYNKEKRYRKRRLLEWDENVIFVYSGSFGHSNINYISISQLINALLKHNKKGRILFLTEESKEKIIRMMNKINITHNNYKVIKPKMNEISYWLSAADIGIHALPKQLDWKTRLGTKVVEYLVNGLPVIVNQNVGAAAKILTLKNFGAVIKDSELEDYKIIKEKISSILTYDKKNISESSKEIFSSTTVSKKYIKCYSNIINF